ncbi:MAG: AAA family ATPase [Thermoanaerobaculum sp.]|nr:AAA family ATPase [Thermoanaerobaculum sp.]
MPHAPGPVAAQDPVPEQLDQLSPRWIFSALAQGVLGQDKALEFVAVSLYKHITGTLPGNLLLIGNSGTGKTTIMNHIQRLYHEVPLFRPLRAMTIINANLLVDSDRMEFRPERLLSAVEQRARAVLGQKPAAAELQALMERATVCVDEVDKMSAVVAGKPNPIGVVLQQGLLTLMEGEVVPFHTFALVDGKEEEVVLPINTRGMMFICGGAFEGLYDQVFTRVTSPGSGEKLKSTAIRTADGQVRIETRFALADFFRLEDLFAYGMVPQFIARFDNVVILNDLTVEVLKQILLQAVDSPLMRSKKYLALFHIDLEVEDLAAALMAEAAERQSRTGARALRGIWGKIMNPIEFDPFGSGLVQPKPEGGFRLVVTADLVRRALGF